MPHYRNTPETFWARIDKTGECWPWQGSKTKAGYGLLSFHGQLVYAHRLAWELTNGPIPEGMEVCHNCPGGDNPACCNPAHHFLGTQLDNMADCSRKGRIASGERSGPHLHPESMRHTAGRKRGSVQHLAKFTDEQVREVRRAYSARESTQYELAAAYGVSQATINGIVLGKTWRHLL